jgi:hypothetical protein
VLSLALSVGVTLYQQGSLPQAFLLDILKSLAPQDFVRFDASHEHMNSACMQAGLAETINDQLTMSKICEATSAPADESANQGICYVLKMKLVPTIIKIGRTKRSIKERLSGYTGLNRVERVVYARRLRNVCTAESECVSMLEYTVTCSCSLFTALFAAH